MKALKILGIVFGVVLLLTGAGLVAGSALVSKGQGAFEQELGKSGYAGPVEGTVKSVDQTSPVIVTVTYTDKQGKKQTGQGAASGPTRATQCRLTTTRATRARSSSSTCRDSAI